MDKQIILSALMLTYVREMQKAALSTNKDQGSVAIKVSPAKLVQRMTVFGHTISGAKLY